MKKSVVVIGVIVAVVAVVAIGLLIAGGLWMRAQGGFGPHMMVRSWGHPRIMGLFGGGLLILVLFGVLAGAIAVLVVGLAGGKQKGSISEPTALDILKKRYASGEIDREEYERMRQELFSHGVITRERFEAEAREKAALSQRREGIVDPLLQEPADVWERRVAKVRDNLTDFYFAYNLTPQHFAEIVLVSARKVRYDCGVSLLHFIQGHR